MEVRDVVLKVGAVHCLVLEGLGSAGYQWTHEIRGIPETVEITAAVHGRLPSGPMTSNVDREYTISALKPGNVSIRFELRRSWEDKAKAPARELLVNVRVTE